MKNKQLLIDGKRIPSVSGKSTPIIKPATDEPLAKVAEGNADDIDSIAQHVYAERGFEWGYLSPHV